MENAPKMKDVYGFYDYAMLLAQVLEGLLIQAIYVFVIIPENREQLIEFEKNGLSEEWENFVGIHNENLIRKTMVNC